MLETCNFWCVEQEVRSPSFEVGSPIIPELSPGLQIDNVIDVECAFFHTHSIRGEGCLCLLTIVSDRVLSRESTHLFTHW